VWSGIAKNTTAEDYCTTLTDVTDVSKTAPVKKEVPLDDNVYYLIYFCIVVMMVNIIFYTIEGCRRKPKPPFCFDEKGVLSKPTRKSIAYMWRPAVLYTIFYVATMIGMGLFLSGYKGLQELFDKYLGTDLDTITNYIWTMSLFIIIIDSVFLVVAWIPTHDILMCQVMMAYYDTIGDEAAAEHWKKRRWFARAEWHDWGSWGSRVSFIFNAMYAALLASLVLAALIAVFGCFNIGLAYGLGQICNGVVGAADDLCFELNVFGVDSLKCGEPFQDFCDEFASKDSVFTYWGAFLSVAGHYYLIASAGATQQMCKELQTIYYLLPNRSQYLQGIADLSESINTGKLERLEEVERLQEEMDSGKEGVQTESSVD
jgi:hypothetical protein